MTGLVTRSARLGGSPDLLPHWVPGEGFFFEHASRAVAGYGAAATITVPAGADQVARAAARARDVLAGMQIEGDRPPIVVGALPFAGSSQATLVVPQVAYVREPDGATWRVETGTPTRDPDQPAAETHPLEPLRVTPVPEPGAYVDAVDKARALIRAGELDKVVLARMLVAQATHVFDRRALLARLRAVEPAATTFAVQGFIGATPELLVARAGRHLTAQPLAGTIARRPGTDDEAAARALLSSAKDRHEHALVVAAVREALEPVCARLDVDAEPKTVATSKVWHLATSARGTLREPAPDALSLAALLHPTPAVCGTPRARAFDLIGELEAIDRALYAGTVGWVDANGDGEWSVILRCAEVAGRIALLFAGAGIVADSDPDEELAETDAKFRAMLDALGYA